MYIKKKEVTKEINISKYIAKSPKDEILHKRGLFSHCCEKCLKKKKGLFKLLDQEYSLAQCIRVSGRSMSELVTSQVQSESSNRWEALLSSLFLLIQDGTSSLMKGAIHI